MIGEVFDRPECPQSMLVVDWFRSISQMLRKRCEHHIGFLGDWVSTLIVCDELLVYLLLSHFPKQCLREILWT